MARITLDQPYGGDWWAEIDDDPDWGTMRDFVDGGRETNMERMSAALLLIVTDWNFKDKRGNVLASPAVDPATIWKVPFGAVTQLFVKASEVINSATKS